MQRSSGMRGFGRGGGGARSSIKSRLGFQTPRRSVPGAGRIAAAAVRSISELEFGGVITQGGGYARGVKARLGAGAKGARPLIPVIGKISDARQKINLNRIQTGRIGDARQKIDEKRRKKAIQSGKIKNLRITTPTELIGNPGGGSGGYTSRTERESMGHHGMFRSAVEDAVSHVLRNQQQQQQIRRSPSMSLTRTIGGGGGYPSGVRIAPPSDDYMLTRTIRNPNAGYGAPISDHHNNNHRSIIQGVAKVAPSIQYGSYSHSWNMLDRDEGGHYNNNNNNSVSIHPGQMGRSSLFSNKLQPVFSNSATRLSHPQRPSISIQQSNKQSQSLRLSSRGREQPMDEDDYEESGTVNPRHLVYHSSAPDSSQCRILVSNLQPSVTADDIVELFSDIGPLEGARMTSSGQAEVTYSRKADAVKAIEAYHNRLLDGSAMRVFLDTSRSSDGNASTGLKSASGASMKLPKSATGAKIQPDISAIHKVLFNPGSSATRGLFKGGQ